MQRIPFRLTIALSIAFAIAITPAQSARAQTYTVLHNFSNGADGGSPESMLTMDSAGSLYGTTLYGGSGNGGLGFGTVFEMVERNGSWNFFTIYDFKGNPGNNDGAGPLTRVVFGANGYLYGTTVSGGGGEECAGFTYFGCGTVFSLSPPNGGGGGAASKGNTDGTGHGVEPLIRKCIVNCPWIEQVLLQFGNGLGGIYPYGGLAFDTAGNIYGTTQLGDGLGTAYELAHADSGWTQSILNNFTGSNGGEPYDTLALDGSGNLYGTARGGGANGYGVVFELSHTESGWVETILHSFADSDGALPFGGLIFDSAGNLYGTTSSGGSGNGGTVFELSPSGEGWQFILLYNFTGSGQWGPADDLTMDSVGNLYGTAYQDGAHSLGQVFKLTQHNGTWTYTDLHDFAGGADGCKPDGGVVLDSQGNIYGTTTGCGTYPNQYGTVWELTQ
jgi:uncharacterized repeat protein (TIGR03803 family)